ncbi:NACHT and WD repeat domain-containing protein [Rhodococcus sp. NPDC058505]|uniref:NACHT and WD repeat domain-containing protein n=1 Tax=unclassified Rhodococcus (in: high G+C Gram-positive bacteria) TaxID=192944 RepID=UPI003653FADC
MPEGPDARLHFADQLRLLFATAGGPPLKTVVSEAGALGRAIGADKQVSIQRLSDWRSGKRVPASFDAVRPVLVVLIRTAQSMHGNPPTPGLYSLKQWQSWWQGARDGGAATRNRAESDRADATPPLAGVRPYRGLEPYRAEDARLFFGRTESLQRLIDVVTAAQGRGMTIVTGASGVGKSSLVQAGLVPALLGEASGSPDAGTAAGVAIVLTPGPDPLGALAAAVPELGALPPAADAAAVRLAMRSAADRLGAAQLVIVVDQIEELFTQCRDPRARDPFLRLLDLAAFSLGPDETADAAPLIIATMRSDFYARALTHPVLADALERRSRAVSPLSRADMVEVITRPAQLIGLKLEAGLVDLILHDLGVLTSTDGGGTVLPLLSHLLDSMWERRRGGQLTVAAYRATGGVRGSVAATAERTWEGLDERERLLARAIMVHLVYVTQTGADVKIRRTLPQLLAFAGGAADPARQVVDRFIGARVLVADADSVELIHDAVIDAWPRLKTWIQEDRSYSAVRQQIEEDASRWEESGRDSSLLYQRGRLDIVREYDAPRIAAEGYPDPGRDGDRVPATLTPVATEFLSTSTRNVRRSTWIARAVMAALVLSTVVALVAVSMAWSAKNRAESERSAAQFRQVVALADSLRSTDPTTAARLSLAAWQMRPGSDTAYSRLIASESTPIGRALDGHTGPVYGVAISPDGSMMASASDDRTVRLWDMRDPAAPHPVGVLLTGSEKYIASVSFAPTGRVLAAGAGDGTVSAWDVTDPAAPRPLLEGARAGTKAVHNIRFSPDGRTLAAPNDDGTVTLFDTSTVLTSPPAPGPYPATTLAAHPAGVRTISFRADSAVMATSSDDRSVRLWDMSNRSAPTPLPPVQADFGDVVHSVAFAPDGRTLAASSDDGVIRLFDTTDVRAVREVGAPVHAHTGAIWTIAFAADGATLVSASWDGTVKRWAVATGRGTMSEVKPALTGNGGGVPALAVSPDGSTVVTGGQDSNLRVWTLPRSALSVSEAALTLPSISRDGSLMATGGYDSVVRMWRVDGDGRAGVVGSVHLPRPFGGAHMVALSPDGTLMATAPTTGGQVQVWDVADPARPRPLGEPITIRTRFTWELAFSPDNRTLATGDDDTSVQLWNLTDPAHPIPWGDRLDGPSNLVRTAAFSPDGSTLVAADADGGVFAWRVDDPARPVPQHVDDGGGGAGINAVSFAPDGSAMATGSDDQTVVMWDRAEDGSLTVRQPALRGHSGTVYSVSFGSDGRHVVSGSDDGTVRLWDVADRDHMREVGGPIATDGSGRWQVAFLPGSDTVVAADGDGVLRAWRLDVAAIIDRICASSSPLTADQETDYELSRSARGECSG